MTLLMVVAMEEFGFLNSGQYLVKLIIMLEISDVKLLEFIFYYYSYD